MDKTIQLPTLTELADGYNLEEIYEHAKVLSPVSAKILEKVLEHNELDIINRARLLAFFHIRFTKAKKATSREVQKSRLKQVLWFIENVPDCRYAGNRMLCLSEKSNRDDFQAISKAWKTAIQKDPGNNQIKINASLFYLEDRPKTAMQLVVKVLDNDPQNAWAVALGKKLSRKHKLPFNFEFRKISSILDYSKELPDDSRNEKSIEYAFRSMHKLNVPAAKTLIELVEKFPTNLTAHRDLMQFYASKSVRLNHLGCDPEYEELFAAHYLWFVRTIPASECHNQIQIPKLPLRLRIELQAEWASTKAKHKGNQQVSQNKTRFDKSCKPLSTKEKSKLNSWRKKQGMSNRTGVLDEIAIDPHQVVVESSYPAFDLHQWSEDASMQNAALTGAYSWFSKWHITQLLEILSEESNDLFHRAMILESAQKVWLSPKHVKFKDIFKTQLKWFITHIPACSFLTEFYWSGLEQDCEFLNHIKSHWLKTIKNTNISRTFLNAALCFWSTDEKEARNLLKRAISLDPDDIFAKDLLQKLSGSKTSISPLSELRRLNFQPGKKIDKLQEAHSKLNNAAWLITNDAPQRMRWTNEKILDNNANDILIRIELNGFYNDHRFCFNFNDRDTMITRLALRHSVWFIQNIPEARLLGMHFAEEHTTPIGHEVELEAWRQQSKAYPKSALVGINIGWAFFGRETSLEEGVKILTQYLKYNKGNHKLLERRKHLKKFLSYRGARR